MGTLAERFFSVQEAEGIRAAVAQAEKGTSGEIVVMVASASHTYPDAQLRAALLFSFPLALVLAWGAARYLWWPGELLWLFLGFFCVSLLGLRFTLPLRHKLWRWCILPEQAATEVEREAVLSFYSENLHHTRQATGVLIYISVLERRVWILADSGINNVLAPAIWQELVQELIQGIRDQKQGAATVYVVERIGGILAGSFPPAADDRNELADLIIRQAHERPRADHPLVIR